MRTKSGSAAWAFIALSAFSLWLLYVAPYGGTLLLVALLYFGFVAHIRSASRKLKSGMSPEMSPARPDVEHPGARPSSAGPSANPKHSKMAPDEEFATIVTAKGGTPSPRYTIDYSSSGFDKPTKGPSAAECWVPEGQSVKVRRYEIHGGLIYVGSKLRSASGHGIEPSLVNPSLKIGTNDDYTERRLPYYPRYDEASEDARAAYLNWLTRGRRDPSADLGYVYLYYYGLERRAFIEAESDVTAASDIPGICTEVRELLSVYGPNSYAFSERAQSFLTFFSARTLAARRLYRESPESFPLRGDNGVFAHRLALSQAVQDKQPFPMDWWFSWLPYSLPRTKAYVSPFFRQLYEDELPQAFPNGVVEKFKPERAAKLYVEHRLVYPGLESKSARTDFDIPDFTSETGRASALLDAFGRTIAEKLEPYTRLVSRSPHKADTAEGLVLLPVSLWAKQTQERLKQKAAAVRGTERMLVKTPLSSLLEPMLLPERLDRPLYLNLVERLAETHSLGIEPDPRFGSPLPGRESDVVLFDLRGGASSEATEAYRRKAAEVWFYSAVARADGGESAAKVAQADAFIVRMKRFAEPERNRLRALLRCYLAQPLAMTGMKKRIELLDDAAKAHIAGNLVLMCQSDSSLNKVANIRVLEKLFEALGQDTEGLYAMAHAGATQASSSSTGSDAAARKKVDPAGLALDMSKIANLREETTQVSEVLGAIFAEEDAATTPSAEAPQPSPQKPSFADAVTPLVSPQPANTEGAPSLPGLDAPHSALVRELLGQPKWSRATVEQMCRAHGLMLEAALEKINDAAYDAAGDALFDGDDELVLNEYVAKELST